MKLPGNILVTTDFSETAEQALDYAVALAAKLGAKVHLVHAIGTPTLGGVSELGVALTTNLIESIVRDSSAELGKLVEARRGKAALGEQLVRTGDARDVILQVAEEVGADLIVMGTHGRRGISRALLGSVAESVVRRARCPVLTVGGRS